jgi:hypothetical protein
MDENSKKGLTKVQKARTSNELTRDEKYFKMHLVLPDAVLTTLLICVENLRCVS